LENSSGVIIQVIKIAPCMILQKNECRTQHQNRRDRILMLFKARAKNERNRENPHSRDSASASQSAPSAISSQQQQLLCAKDSLRHASKSKGTLQHEKHDWKNPRLKDPECATRLAL
jgi:hypothetical protein